MTRSRGILLAGKLTGVLLALSAVVMTAASKGSLGGPSGASEAERLNGDGVKAYEAGDYP